MLARRHEPRRMESRQGQASRSRLDAGRPRLRDRRRDVIRRLHYSIGTEQAYVDGVRRFILYLPKALHPCNPGSSCSTGSGIRRRGGRWKWKRFRSVSRSMSTSRRPARTGR